MGDYCKHYKQKQQISFNSGRTWSDVIEDGHLVTREGSLYDKCSSDCGYGIVKKWVTTTDTVCIGEDRRLVIMQQISYDGGKTFNDTDIYQAGEIVEPGAAGCGCKLTIHPSIGEDQCIDCGFNMTISKSDIGNWPVSNITGLTIGECANAINDFAFEKLWHYDGGCITALLNIDIPDNITSMGKYVLNDCEYLTGATIGSGLTSISTGTFNDCIRLTDVSLPDTITNIGAYAFKGCRALSGVTIPSGVTIIGNYAFSGCTSLTSVTIPSGVTNIGRSAFNDCRRLTEIRCLAETPPILSNPAVFYDTNDCPIIVPCNSVPLYKIEWSNYASRIQGDNTCPIAASFKYSNGSVYSIDCVEGTTVLTKEMIREYSASVSTMREAYVGDTCLEGIGNYAFSGATSLIAVTIADNINEIGNGAFYDCSSLSVLLVLLLFLGVRT